MKTCVRLDRLGRDQRALEEAERDAEHDLAVLERARLGLVGVDHEVVRLGDLVRLRHEAPLAAGREEGAAAAAQVRGVELLDHLVGRHRARLRERLEAADGLVVGDLGQRAAVRAGEDDLRRRCAIAALLQLDAAQLGHDARHVVGLHVQPVAVVDRDDRRPAAAAEALDRAQRELVVRLARRDAELALERLDHLLGALEPAGDVRADLDHVLADGLEPEHVVERRDREAVGGRQVERVGDVAERLLGEPAAVALLRELERRHHRRQALGVARPDLLDLVVERAHRSTSPMTPSSEPTIAIMSAIAASVMQVAVACSATKLGARNLTRQGFGPPSETT